MKKILKTIAIVFAVLLVGMIGIVAWMTKGLSQGQNVVVDGIDLSRVEDGEYTGSYSADRWANTLIVHVRDHKITNIEIEKNVLFYTQEVSDVVFAEVIAKQSLDIDIQAGATVTTKAYLKAIEDALDGE